MSRPPLREAFWIAVSEVLSCTEICDTPETLRHYGPKTNDSAAWLADCLRETVEPFLYNAGVDIVLHGAPPWVL